jgi:hypothetical protein
VQGAEPQKDGTVFTAASIGIPAAVVKTIPADQRMDTYRDMVMTPLKGKVVETKNIKQGNMAGKEYLIETPKSVMRMQLYMLGGFGFFAMVEGKTKDRVTEKDAESFYASFKLADAK